MNVMNDNAKITKLSMDEAGVLKGGFSVETIDNASNNFFATNKNCTGGGWCDVNTNCTGTCAECSVDKPSGGTSSGTTHP